MKINITLILLFVSASLFSQPWLKTYSSAEIETFGLNEHQAAFEDFWKEKEIDNGYYFEDGVKTKAYGWKQFKRWESYWSTRVNPETGEFPSSKQRADAEAMFQALSQNRSVSGAWTNLGPSSSDGGYAGVGRLNCIAFHPTETNTFWVGAPTGGLWKTTDGGTNWSVLTDDNNVLGVSAVAIPSDYETSQTIYIGTGDRDSWQHDNGEGILKSTDGGLTWNTSLFFDVADSYTVNQILIDPTDNDILYAATSNGIYKTINAGTNWTQIYAVSYISDLEFKPGDPTILYASNKYWGKIYKLTNSGASSSIVFDEYSYDANRIELAVSPSNPSLVYAIVGNGSGGLKGLYKSTNSGTTFSLVSDYPNILANNVDGTGESGQAWYDLALIVDPLDEDILYSGGVNTWKSTNGGVSWEVNNFWTSYYCSDCEIAHADKHFFAYNGSTLYECNDGGLYKTDDGSTWDNISNGIVNSQMYSIAVSQQNSGISLAGLQDNGTKLKDSDGTWYDVIGGDGMNCEIDPVDDNYMYGAIQNGRVRKSTNGFSFNVDITKDSNGDPINGLDETGAWLTPYVIDPNATNTLYIGLSNVWKSLDRGDSWTKISTIDNDDELESICLSASNDQVIYTAENEQIWMTSNGGTSWIDVSTGLPGSYITSIAIKNDDDNTVWVTLGSYNSDVVYQTINGGSTWTNISSGLPDIPANTITQNTQNLEEIELYVGTDFGVYVKVGTADWVLFNTGMPKVAVTDLDIYYDAVAENSILRAGTWGRGLWESDLYVFESPEPEVEFTASLTELCVDNTVEFTDMSSNEPTEWVWVISPNTGFNFVNSTDANSENPEIEFTQVGQYSVQLSASNDDGTGVLLKSEYIQINDVPGQPSLISGEIDICEGSEQIYTVEETEGITYNWMLPNGWIGDSETESISIVSNELSGTITISAENICGESTEQSLAVNVTALPISPVFDLNPTEVCESEELIYSVINNPDYTYNWNLPTDWIGESSANSITVVPNSNSGIVSVTSENSCGESENIQVSVIVSSVPETPILETEHPEICNAEEVMFVVTNDDDYTYNWTLPDGWAGSSTTSEISVVNNGVSGTVTLNAENDCGISELVTVDVTVIDGVPELPSIISGEANICENAEEIYSVELIEGLIYNWNIPEGWEGSSSTNSIAVTPNNSGGTISLMAQNICGYSQEQSLSIDVMNIPALPSLISGSNPVCEADEEVYTVDPIEGLIYNWELPNSWLGNSETSAISATVGNIDGLISVFASNECGESELRTKDINVNLLPVANFSYTEEMAIYSFNNLSENADSYIWSFGDDTESTDLHPQHTYIENGVYTINLTAQNDCSDDIFESEIEVLNIGISEKELELIQLFPNPSKGVISIIGLKNMPSEIKVFDLTGRNLIHKRFDAQNSVDIDLSRYTDGAYQIVIKQGEKLFKKLLVLQK